MSYNIEELVKGKTAGKEPINPELYKTALKEIGDGVENLVKGALDLGMSYVLPPDGK